MKKLVMTVEMKEVNFMDPWVAENTGVAFARIADVLMHVRTKMYDPPMSFDEYVDELQRISDLVAIGNYGDAMESMYNLAEKMDRNLSTILEAYIMQDEVVMVPFLDYFFNQITLNYQQNRIYEEHSEDADCECNCDCCDWLMQHANEAEDISFRELIKTLSQKSWEQQHYAIARYFEDKRSHPLLVKCIETNSNCWPYHI